MPESPGDRAGPAAPPPTTPAPRTDDGGPALVLPPRLAAALLQLSGVTLVACSMPAEAASLDPAVALRDE